MTGAEGADQAVDGAVEILPGDWRRKGKLEPDDIARVAEKRQLEFEQLHAVLAALKIHGIVAAGPVSGDTKPRSATGLQTNPNIDLLTSEEECSLANAIQLGARLEAAEDKSPEALKLIDHGRRARNKFVTKNLKLIHWVAQAFRQSGIDPG